MKGSLSSIESRDVCDFLRFDIDERSFNPEGTRIVTKAIALDGTGLTTDWGYVPSSISITASNFHLSRDDYDKLIAMKEDASYSFLFHYRNSTWRVIIQNAFGISDGDRMRVTDLGLNVVEKYPNGETS